MLREALRPMLCLHNSRLTPRPAAVPKHPRPAAVPKHPSPCSGAKHPLAGGGQLQHRGLWSLKADLFSEGRRSHEGFGWRCQQSRR